MLNNILPLVNRPVRYINSEWNSVHKKNVAGAHQGIPVKTCFCFPDMYELGVSNLGIEILYDIVNRRNDAVAERCYSPDTDLENIMRKENIKLFSLESQTALKRFDIIGFSLQFELCFTNVLNMLDLAGIPLKNSDRDLPLIIAGGPVCANPEPIAEYIDAFVIGEGEEVINEIIDKFKEWKYNNVGTGHLRCLSPKKTLLELLNQIPGIYVPSFYTPGKKISKRNVNIETSPYPLKPVVPYIQSVHNRLNIEISRGCVHNCRFCQATNLYSPVRERSIERIMFLIEEGIKNTGYGEVSLSGFSVSDYSSVEKLLQSVSEFGQKNCIFISVPSLRCDSSALKLLPYLVKPHRANLTLAPETGSERLRKSIGKNITNQEIINTISEVNRSGWKMVKLYFMLGLPTETDEEVSSTIDLMGHIRHNSRKLKFNITISPFVPKPHTPFQRAKQEEIGSMVSKQQKLIRKLPGEIKAHNPYMSCLEGIFARGDRNLSKVIYTAWQKGCRFDHWKEKFQYKLWVESFEKCGIDMQFYLRERQSDEILPWQHIIL